MLVRPEVVHHDDVSGTQLRNKDLPHVLAEDFAVRWRIDCHGCRPPVPEQRSDDGSHAPMPVGSRVADPFATGRTPVPAGHVRRDARLVDEDEPQNVPEDAFRVPRLALLLDCGSVLLGGAEGFFL